MIIKKRKVNEKLIPMVNNYWYSPDGPGGKKAIKKLKIFIYLF
jgi:hypothetical protein